ncbi:uncharacterized protein LOC114025889 [Vombatus ursinus]|uniref:uncharacterized protein LOC114025688 n=1 Tax=Vombatus ursinus TaxID=29139 RepID=UPI000FFD6257|nr:uncharacterized protein LOC114025688 [Vombatus ursinus]XP_027695200.1 uncharacterized protein LOC114025889 [Vombatus ursinus]
MIKIEGQGLPMQLPEKGEGAKGSTSPLPRRREGNYKVFRSSAYQEDRKKKRNGALLPRKRKKSLLFLCLRERRVKRERERVFRKSGSFMPFPLLLVWLDHMVLEAVRMNYHHHHHDLYGYDLGRRSLREAGTLWAADPAPSLTSAYIVPQRISMDICQVTVSAGASSPATSAAEDLEKKVLTTKEQGGSISEIDMILSIKETVKNTLSFVPDCYGERGLLSPPPLSPPPLMFGEGMRLQAY